MRAKSCRDKPSRCRPSTMKRLQRASTTSHRPLFTWAADAITLGIARPLQKCKGSLQICNTLNLCPLTSCGVATNPICKSGASAPTT